METFKYVPNQARNQHSLKYSHGPEGSVCQLLILSHLLGNAFWEHLLCKHSTFASESRQSNRMPVSEDQLKNRGHRFRSK